MKCNLAVLLLLTTAGLPGLAAEKHEKTAQEFKFEDIGFESTLTQFKEKFPDAVLDEKNSNKELGVTVLDNKEVPNARLAEYMFVDEKLLSIKIYYTAEDFKNSGGLELFFDTLRERFGKWDKDSPELSETTFHVFWNFPKVNRYIEFKMDDNRGVFQVVNSKLAAELLEKRKKKADFGF